MRLENQTRKSVLAERLLEARSFRERLLGLIPRSQLSPNEGVWFRRCRSIHTGFMRFDLDVIFVDGDFRVVDRIEGLKPWKFVLPVWKARDVFELPIGTIRASRTEIGDQLNVGNPFS